MNPSDLLVLNDSRVFPARLYGKKPGGGAVELLLLRPIGLPELNREKGGLLERWEVLVKGKTALPLELVFEEGVTGSLARELEGGRKEIVFILPEGGDPDVYAFSERWGTIPLPPYILKRRGGADRVDPSDKSRYQTVYAEKRGSAAAPTAGLHFTAELIEKIKKKGTGVCAVTLHIGLDTFQPIRTERITDHPIHRERFEVPSSAAEAIEETRKKGGRVVAVGTTSTRALESAAQDDGTIRPGAGETGLFITPGYRFKAVDALVTNFHLPKSTLLALVSAFAGCEAIREIYQEAIREKYRFYSYGDAMLIL